MPSSKLDTGEPLREGAARELREETGLDVDPAHLRLMHVVLTARTRKSTASASSSKPSRGRERR
ncbi:NUDIX domain-containing protein [Streptomyces sp. NBC_00120]|uniref:NUDIX domain-containing protein n=1 Tax=Streptomyces sp. NBC_00120 TaxID=2975660 RepID=UPI002B1D82D1|nr:NUDIX domain-containing protein [Streptomyces sp. NBC_00120]